GRCARSPVDEQAGRVARLDGLLGDPLGRQVVVELVGVHGARRRYRRPAMGLHVEVDAVDGGARATTITTHRGTIPTPCFMPVGTRGTIRAADSVDLARLGAPVVLANTYHLMLKPGADVVAGLGGLHRFMGWEGHVLTDSGGFQVFSLEEGGNVRLDDEGVTFRSTYDGSSHRLTPESAVAIQEALGADVQMQLDVCPALPSPPDVVRSAVERTLAWGARALGARRRTADQLLFGIVQGGVDTA